METGRLNLVYLVKRFLFGVWEYLAGTTQLLDQSKIDYKLTKWELSFLSISIVGEYRRGLKIIDSFIGKCIFWGVTIPLTFIIADIFYFRIIIPFISLFGFVGWLLIPNLRLFKNTNLNFHEVEISKRQKNVWLNILLKGFLLQQ